jgi:hypothetical protein
VEKNDKKPESTDSKSNERSGEKPWWSEAMKELTLTGLATVFMTEDSVRSYLKEKKLPKELVGVFLEGIGKKKEDFYGRLASEIGLFLGKIDLSKELAKFLEKHKVNIQISFERKETK